MAKVLQSFEFTDTVRSGKHDWNFLCSGQILQLKQGEDFAGKKKWFAVQCRTQAKKRGLRVRLSGHNDESTPTIVVQFINPNAVQQSAPTAPPPAAPAKKKGK